MPKKEEVEPAKIEPPKTETKPDIQFIDE